MRKVTGKSGRGSNGEKAEQEQDSRFVRGDKSPRLKRRGSSSGIRDELPLPMEDALEKLSVPSLKRAIDTLGKALGVKKIPDSVQQELVSLIVEVPPEKREAIFDVLMDRVREDLAEALYNERRGSSKRTPGSSIRNPTPTLEEYEKTGRKAEGRRSVNLSPLNSGSGSACEE